MNVAENPWPLITIFIVLAVLALALWKSSGRTHYFVIALFLLAGCPIAWLVAENVVTDGERVRQLVHELAADFCRKDPKTLDYFSDNAPELKVMATGAMALVTVREFRLTDFQTTFSRGGQTVSVHFRANGTLNVVGFGDVGHQPLRLILEFRREAGTWKIFNVQRLNPVNGEQMETLQKSTT